VTEVTVLVTASPPQPAAKKTLVANTQAPIEIFLDAGRFSDLSFARFIEASPPVVVISQRYIIRYRMNGKPVSSTALKATPYI
jgi:hypothetical protein